MTDSYTWQWISEDVALETVHRPMKVADAEALEAAMPGHRADGPADGRTWGLVIDLRNGGVADEAVQAVLMRVMRAGGQSGCIAVAMVVTKAVVQMQSKRLSEEAKQPFTMFDSVDDAIAFVSGRLAAAA
jgi:hypothetical protein